MRENELVHEKKTAAPPSIDPVIEPPVPPSTPPVADLSSTSGYIPEPPPIIDENIILNALGEPTLHSLGLNSWWPIGRIQWLLELLHVDLGLEWYQAIIAFTVALRLLLFPVNVLSQRNAVSMKKFMPGFMHLQTKLSDAKVNGNNLEVARTAHEINEYRRINDFKFSRMFVPLIQVPFAISTFLAIRRMARLPVESFAAGGALWFTDFTMVDPYWALPMMASASIIAIIYRGIDTGVSANNMAPMQRYLFYGFGAISFPFLIFQPSSVSFYICVTNFISLIYSILLSFDAVKKILKIPILSEYELQQIKESQKKQKSKWSEAWDKYQNMKITAEVKERDKLREQIYKQAGTKLPERTYRENPMLTKKKSS